MSLKVRKITIAIIGFWTSLIVILLPFNMYLPANICLKTYTAPWGNVVIVSFSKATYYTNQKYVLTGCY